MKEGEAAVLLAIFAGKAPPFRLGTTVEVGFHEPGFYEPSPLMNFFSIPYRFPISPNIKNVGFYELRFL